MLKLIRKIFPKKRKSLKIGKDTHDIGLMFMKLKLKPCPVVIKSNKRVRRC